MKTALFLAMLATVACNFKFSFNSGLKGSGEQKVESRAIEPFHAVTAGGALQVNIGVSPAPPKLEIRGDDNLLPHVRAVVSNGELKLDTDVDVSPNVPLVVTLNTATLDSVHFSGAGKVDARGIRGSKFDLSLSGAAEAKLAGDPTETTLHVSGAASIDAYGLLAERTTVTLSGAGSAHVFASQRLDATISGAGSVTYDGNPAEVKQNISGVGSIARKPR